MAPTVVSRKGYLIALGALFAAGALARVAEQLTGLDWLNSLVGLLGGLFILALGLPFFLVLVRSGGDTTSSIAPVHRRIAPVKAILALLLGTMLLMCGVLVAGNALSEIVAGQILLRVIP